jgi:hypothetical protein
MDDSPSPKRVLETTLERVADDLDDATHARMDQEVLNRTKPEKYLCHPFVLLVTIVSTSGGKLDSAYAEYANALALLQEHPQLSDELLNAWEQEPKTFRDIRNLSTSALHYPGRKLMVLTLPQKFYVQILVE